MLRRRAIRLPPAAFVVSRSVSKDTRAKKASMVSGFAAPPSLPSSHTEVDRRSVANISRSGPNRGWNRWSRPSRAPMSAQFARIVGSTPPTSAGSAHTAKTRPGCGIPADDAALQTAASVSPSPLCATTMPCSDANRSARSATGLSPPSSAAVEGATTGGNASGVKPAAPRGMRRTHQLADAARMELTRPSNPAITYGTYPAMALLTAVVVGLTLQNDWNRSAIAALLAIVPVVGAVLVEWRYPLGREWRMTKSSFLSRDLPFIVLAIVTERLAETLAVLAAAAVVVTTDGFGPLARLPVGVQVAVTLMVFDLLWYGYHRAAHNHSRLWRVHGVHHAPAQLYALMHLVFHPFDLLASRFVVAAIAFRLTG